MKRFYTIVVSLLILAVCFATNFKTTAQIETDQAASTVQASPNIVISQFQTAGGNPGDEFIELHNITSNNFDLNGFRLVYRSASGTGDVSIVNWTSGTIIAPGGFYLIASTAYDGSTVPDMTFNSASCSCALSAGGGGLAIRSGAVNSGVVIDAVGYGSATNAFVETRVTNAPPTGGSQSRAGNGCQDTDNNANDFSTVNPSAPRNAASSANACSGGSGGTTILAGGGASPNTVSPGGMTLLTVSVLPATTPPSTGISVFGNLTNIGGASNQQFFDDGTNGGDVTANDNIFSYTATIPADASGGVRNITATVSDAQTRTANVSISITINAPVVGEDHLALGNPSNATSNVANENNYLMLKPQYSLSYNRSRATPNWVSWRLDNSWLGSAPRRDLFRPDTTLPFGWYQVTDSSYSGSGFDRGHHTPSGDRTRSPEDNSATFLMTNMMPQSAGNNQGPWNDLEIYSRSLIPQGNELYISMGGTGSGGVGTGGSVVHTIDNGRITVPAQTWKVILVLPVGDNDASRVNNNTRTIAVIMPNINSIYDNDWQQYLVTVDEVEALTGYDFFSNVAPETQAVIESRVDGQTNTTPTITAQSDVARQQGNGVSNSQIGTAGDADQTENTLVVTVNGGSSATVNGVTLSGISIDAAGVITANIVATPSAAAAMFTLRVTDNQGSFKETTLNVAITPGSYEADIDPRATNGNQVVDSGDLIQIRRFVNRTDTPNAATNEFQRADSAPLDPATGKYGNGIIDAEDIVQTIRYANRSDSQRSAAGPTDPTASGAQPATAGKEKEQPTSSGRRASEGLTNVQRQLSVQSVNGSASGTVVVNILVDAIGDEAQYALTLNFDPNVLTLAPSASSATSAGAGGTRQCSLPAETTGELACTVGDFPNDQVWSSRNDIGEIAAGDGQVLLTVRFVINANAAPSSTTQLSITHESFSDDAPPSTGVLTVVNGTVTMTGPSAATGGVGGRVTNTVGIGIGGVTVSLLDTASGATQTALTNGDGRYTFANLTVSTDYLVSVRLAGHSFSPASRQLTLQDEARQLNFTATSKKNRRR